MNTYIYPLLGGVLIGFAVSLMLYFNGRIAGVSGIINGSFQLRKNDFLWRISFIAGLFVAGLILQFFWPESLSSNLIRSDAVIIIAGLLVGFGTVMGGGCTSGHGICGISRLSFRSIVATLIFMLMGIISATFFRLYFAGVL
jgi:hypothetical protein